MATSFEDITRRLDLNPATRDTTYDKARAFGRAIKKINVGFTVPATTATNLGGCLLAQVNYTMTNPFKILRVVPKWTITNLTTLAWVAIRYRVAGVVYRYKIPYTLQSSVLGLLRAASGLQCEWYNGEVIQPNFCVEYWGLLAFGAFSLGEFDIVTSRLRLPTSPDEENYSIDIAGTVLTRANLEQPMPETMPVVYGAASQWLTN